MRPEYVTFWSRFECGPSVERCWSGVPRIGLSFSYPLRFLFASHPAILGQELGIVYRVIAGHLIKKAGFTRRTARTGAVTLMMCLDARMPRSA